MTTGTASPSGGPATGLPVVLTGTRQPVLDAQDHPDAVTGACPGHLPRRRRPRSWPGASQPGAPAVVADTAYPWSAVGEVHVPGGWSSGVLVGPRHLLTAAHVVPWARRPGGVEAAPGLRFAPAEFDGVEPFGSASVIAVYAVDTTDPPAIDGTEERVDYAVCVLDRPIGLATGWFGVRAYRDAWDGLVCWCMVGYRSEPGVGVRPRYQEGIALDGCDDQEDCHQVLYHAGDVHPGQSGGPVFGWWPDEEFPRVVAVQSWGWPGRAGASGGDHLVDLVIRARRDAP
jgi:Trypsin-like peptidase domain